MFVDGLCSSSSVPQIWLLSCFVHNVCVKRCSIAQNCVVLQEGGSNQDTISVANCMLHKAETAFQQLEQNMFFVANDLDKHLAMDRYQCSLRIALLKKHAAGVHSALERLSGGGCPQALWRAAAVLRYGTLHLLMSILFLSDPS